MTASEAAFCETEWLVGSFTEVGRGNNEHDFVY